MKWYTSTAYENAEQVSTIKGFLYSFSGYNSGPSQWIQVYDVATTPVDGSIPKIILYVDANNDFSWTIDFFDFPFRFVNGLYICNSTTGPTKTLGAANTWFVVQFE